MKKPATIRRLQTVETMDVTVALGGRILPPELAAAAVDRCFCLLNRCADPRHGFWTTRKPLYLASVQGPVIDKVGLSRGNALPDGTAKHAPHTAPAPDYGIRRGIR